MKKILFLLFSIFFINVNISSAWNDKYIIKVDSYLPSVGDSRSIEMQKKYDYDFSNKYRGEIDRYGDVRVRNYNGDVLRGNIDSQGYGTLRDYKGNIYKVRPGY